MASIDDSRGEAAVYGRLVSDLKTHSTVSVSILSHLMLLIYRTELQTDFGSTDQVSQSLPVHSFMAGVI